MGGRVGGAVADSTLRLAAVRKFVHLAEGLLLLCVGQGLPLR